MSELAWLFFVRELLGILERSLHQWFFGRAYISGDYYTSGSPNPARSLGPDVIKAKFPGYHWIYWVGPLLVSLSSIVCLFSLSLTEYQPGSGLQ